MDAIGEQDDKEVVRRIQPNTGSSETCMAIAADGQLSSHVVIAGNVNAEAALFAVKRTLRRCHPGNRSPPHDSNAINHSTAEHHPAPLADIVDGTKQPSVPRNPAQCECCRVVNKPLIYRSIVVGCRACTAAMLFLRQIETRIGHPKWIEDVVTAEPVQCLPCDGGDDSTQRDERKI